MPGGNITVAVKALSLMVMTRDERIGEKRLTLPENHERRQE